MQAKMSFSGKKIGIFKKLVIQENIFEIDYIIKSDLLFESGQKHSWNLLASFLWRKVIRGLNKFPDLFRMGTFIDNTHMKL